MFQSSLSFALLNTFWTYTLIVSSFLVHKRYSLWVTLFRLRHLVSDQVIRVVSRWAAIVRNFFCVSISCKEATTYIHIHMLSASQLRYSIRSECLGKSQLFWRFTFMKAICFSSLSILMLFIIRNQRKNLPKKFVLVLFHLKWCVFAPQPMRNCLFLYLQYVMSALEAVHLWLRKSRSWQKWAFTCIPFLEPESLQ